MARTRGVILAAGIAACTSGAHVKQDIDLTWRPAIDLVLSAFEQHPLVAVSEGAGHGQLETRDFFATLIRDRRFAPTVRNVVIEFGNARYQAVLDRYVTGGAVTRDELRHLWEDTTQISGVWSLPMYEQMLADVRSVNEGLPPATRIRVIAGDPPIDWSTVTSPADEDMNDWRDAHFAHVIEREVVRKRERSLILIGGAHVSRRVMFPNSLIHLLDSRFPGQTWVAGILDLERVEPDIRSRLRADTAPAGTSVRNTWLRTLDSHRIGFNLSSGNVGDNVDALLLLNSSRLHAQPPTPLDRTYETELMRRRALADATLPFRGAKIRFKDGVAEFEAAADEPLHVVLKELLRDRGLRVLVKAFADETEVDADTLSLQRASLVADWLAARGIERDRLTPRGCGARRPLTFGNTALGRAMNRRAELVRLAPTAACEPPW
ncbi:MAG TPA: OmpA family protein [Gemmatimonadaceae bacterium]|nr:OmpA family protein [Gemmatimonadaceae bacterium]